MVLFVVWFGAAAFSTNHLEQTVIIATWKNVVASDFFSSRWLVFGTTQSSNPELIFLLCMLVLLFVVIATPFTATLEVLSFICRFNRETHGCLNDVSELSSDKLKCLLLAVDAR